VFGFVTVLELLDWIAIKTVVVIMMMIQMQKTFTPITSVVADSPLTQSLSMIEYDPNGENLYTHYLRWS
jgi:hypothetical protein